MNIYQRINQVRENVSYVRKEKRVEQYKAVTHDQVTAEIRPHLIKSGIVVVPALDGQPSMVEAGKTQKGTMIMRHEAIYIVRFVNVDDPNDAVETRVAAHANDHGDKAPGKALSYAVKAAILKIFSIETGEDDEARTTINQQPVDDTPVSVKDAEWIRSMAAEIFLDDKDKSADEKRAEFLAKMHVDTYAAIPARFFPQIKSRFLMRQKYIADNQPPEPSE